MAAQSDSKVSALALSIHQEMGEQFAKTVTNGQAQASIGGRQVSVDVLSGDPRLNAGWDEATNQAGIILLLVRFLDVISLDKVKAIYRRLPTDSGKPIAVVIVREQGESDFKMSCPVCGQKLWVRDSDVGKKGRCPNCKKAFSLPDQVAHLRGQLALPDSMPVLRIASGDASSVKAAVEKVLEATQGGLIDAPNIDQEVLKQSTMRVNIND